MKGVAIKYSDDELAFVERNSSLNRVELTALFNAEFNRDVLVSHIHSLCRRKGWKSASNGQFCKGQAPFNKGKKGVNGVSITTFKKGNIPHNHKQVGSERVNVDGYIEVKTKEPNTWRLKHRVIWEAENGKIPIGGILIFKDNDKLNCDIENLLLVTRAEHLYINRHGLSALTGELKETVKNIATMNCKLQELTK